MLLPAPRWIRPTDDKRAVGPIVDQLHSHAVDRCGPAGQFRTSRDAMALAPLVYTLWNRVIVSIRRDPIWPNRDRFLLSNGHASMLLWSVLLLTGTRAVNAEYERLGQPAVSLDDIHPSVSSAARPRVTPNTIWCPGSRPPPDRSARALPPALAWPSPRRGSPTATIGRTSRNLRLQHLCDLR